MAIKFLNSVNADSGVLYVDALNNRVGIGTTSPGSGLDVRTISKFWHGSTTNYTTFAHGNEINTFNSSGGDAVMYLQYRSGLLNVGAGTLIVQSGNNNVGIGTTSPSYKLDVAGDARIDNYLRFSSTGTYVRNSASGALVLAANSGYIVTGWGARLQVPDGSGTVAVNLSGVVDSYINGVNFGIGTTSPAGKIDVKGTVLWGADAQGRLTYSTTDAYIDALKTGGDIYIRTNGTATDAMAILSSGNVGIGTTSPAYKLDVVGTARVNSKLLLDSADYAQHLSLRRGVYGMDFILTGNRLDLSPTASTTELKVLAKIRTTGDLLVDGDAQLSSYGSGSNTGTATYALAVDSSGNIIETTVQSSPAGIDGTGTVNYLTKWSTTDTLTSSVMYDDGTNIGIGTTSPDSLVEIENGPAAQSQSRMLHIDNNPASNQGSGYIEISSGSNNQAKTQIEQVSSGGFGLLGNNYIDTNIINRGLSSSSHGNINFATGSSTSATSIVMTIGGGSQKGNVGIGTTSPAAKLVVAGTAYINQTSDYFGISNTKVQISAGSSSDNVGIRSDKLYLYSYGNGTDSQLIFGDGNAHWGLFANDNRFALYNHATSATSIHVSSTGNVGIGTTSPSEKLDVSGNAQLATTDPILKLYDTSATSYATTSGKIEFNNNYATVGYIHQDGESMHLNSRGGSGTIILATNGGERMRLTSGGQLIVGGTTVGYAGTKLQVGNTADSQNGLNILTSNTGYGYILFGDGSGADTYVGQITYKHGDDFMAFNTNGSEKVRILANGNVGIGTTSPASKLHVNGKVTIGNIGTTAPQEPLMVKTETAAYFPGIKIENYNSEVGLYIQNIDGYNAGIGTGRYYNSGFWRSDLTSPTSVRFDQGVIRFYAQSGVTADTDYTATERMRITADGKVGIGDSSPSYKLDVTGDARFTSHVYSNASMRAPIFYDIDDTNYYINPTGATSAILAGSVGIGTTNPATTVSLQFTDSSTTQSQFHGLLISNTNTTVNNGSAITFGHSGSAKNSHAKIGAIYADRTSASEDTHLFFGTLGGGSYSERMRITSTGHIGMGTTAPYAYLHVKPSNSGSAFSNVEGLLVETGGSSNSYYALQVATAGGGKSFNVTNAGNVGIGTASPTEKLHVYNQGTAMIKVDSDAVSPYKAGIEFVRSSINGGRIYNDGGAVQVKLESDFGYDSANPTRGGFLFKTAPVTSGTLVDALRIDARGYVGIGTSSPSEKLHVSGNVRIEGDLTVNGSYTQIDTNTLTTEQWNVTNDGTGPAVTINQKGAQDIMDVQDDGTSVFYIEDGGNVGIGTTSPAAKLEVDGVFNASEILLSGTVNKTFSSGSGDTYGQIYLNPIRGNRSISITTQQISQGEDIDGTAIDVFYTNTGNANDLLFKNGGANTMVVKANNRVGIGTTNPNEKLQVAGNVNAYAPSGIDAGLFASTAAGSTTIALRSNGVTHFNGGNVGIGTTSPSGSLDIYGTTGNKLQIGYFTDQGADDPTLRMFYGKATRPSYSFTSDNTSGMFSGSGGGIVAFATSANERMRITSGGNVGVGTTSPGYKLEVQGDFYVNGTNGAFTTANSQSNLYMLNLTRTSTSLITAGRVGIGTASPSQMLHVVGSALIENDLSFGIGGLLGTSTSIFTLYSLGDLVYNSDSNNNGTSNHIFQESGNELMRITSTGNVGIGTTSPSEKLEVNGNVKADSFIADKGAGIYTFSDTVTASTSEDIFSISNNHGAQAFRVTFVCSTSGYSVAKTFEVVHSYGNAPVFFKVVDTGVFSSHDFDVSFTNSNTDTGVTCSITNNSTTINADIVTTVFLGGSPTAITVTAL